MVARDPGALGGKITGAGGGGILVLYCREERQPALTTALEARGLRWMDFRLEPRGVTLGAVQWAHESARSDADGALAGELERLTALATGARRDGTLATAAG